MFGLYTILEHIWFIIQIQLKLDPFANNFLIIAQVLHDSIVTLGHFSLC